MAAASEKRKGTNIETRGGIDELHPYLSFERYPFTELHAARLEHEAAVV